MSPLGLSMLIVLSVAAQHSLCLLPLPPPDHRYKCGWLYREVSLRVKSVERKTQEVENLWEKEGRSNGYC